VCDREFLIGLLAAMLLGAGIIFFVVRRGMARRPCRT